MQCLTANMWKLPAVLFLSVLRQTSVSSVPKLLKRGGRAEVLPRTSCSQKEFARLPRHVSLGLRIVQGLVTTHNMEALQAGTARKEGGKITPDSPTSSVDGEFASFLSSQIILLIGVLIKVNDFVCLQGG